MSLACRRKEFVGAQGIMKAAVRKKEFASIHVNSRVKRFDKHTLDVLSVMLGLKPSDREAVKVVIMGMLVGNELRS